MNMTILANTYYEKLPGKWSTYFQEEYEKIKIENADTLGARIEFLKKRLIDLCTQRYVVNGAKYGEKIFCDKIDNIPGLKIMRQRFDFLFFYFYFSLASLFDIRKSDRQNSSGQEAKCSTR